MSTTPTKFPALTPQDSQGECIGLNRNFRLVGTALDAIEQTAANQLLLAYANADLTLTGTPTEIPGAGVIVPVPGVYLVNAVVMFVVQGAGDLGFGMVGQLAINGQRITGAVNQIINMAAAAQPQSGTCPQQWRVEVTNPNTRLSILAWKLGGAGTSSAAHQGTSISALYVGTLPGT